MESSYYLAILGKVLFYALATVLLACAESRFVGNPELDGGANNDTDINAPNNTDAHTDIDSDTDTDIDSDTDTDIDSDADTDTDSDADSGSDCKPKTDPCCDVTGNSCTSCTDGLYCDFSVCQGGKLDPNTGLCWQDPAYDVDQEWSNANSYCENLTFASEGEWRLPMIQELISLIRDCDSRACRVSDPTCLSSTCADGSDCEDCGGNDNCYWDTALSGSCDSVSSQRTWSSSQREDTSAKQRWTVAFRRGKIYHTSEGLERWTRCVRSGP